MRKMYFFAKLAGRDRFTPKTRFLRTHSRRDRNGSMRFRQKLGGGTDSRISSPQNMHFLAQNCQVGPIRVFTLRFLGTFCSKLGVGTDLQICGRLVSLGNEFADGSPRRDMVFVERFWALFGKFCVDKTFHYYSEST